MTPARSLSLHARHRIAAARRRATRLRSDVVQPLESLDDDFKKIVELGLVPDGAGNDAKRQHRIPRVETVNSHRHSALWAAVHFAQILADHHRQLFRSFLFLCRGLHCLAL